MLAIDTTGIAPLVAALSRVSGDAAAIQQRALAPAGDAYLAALQAATPVGQGKTRGKRLRDSYKTKQQYSASGGVYTIQNKKPYLKWVLNGRPAIEAKGKALRFVIGGTVFFRRRVGPAAANPFDQRVRREMQPRLDRIGNDVARGIIAALGGK